VRASLERIVSAGWPVLVGVVLGLAAAGIWTLAQPDRYRAEARVLVRGTARGLAPAVKALAESSLLEQNVAQTLRLSHPPRVSATIGAGGVLTLSAEADSRDRARQLDGEAALVLTQLVGARFGTGVQATVLDPAHPVEQTSPTPGRNLLIGGVIGLVAGAAAAVALGRRRPAPVIERAPDPSVERRLLARIDAVAKRERALARRAGELAEREARLLRREADLAAAEHEAATVEPEREREPEPEPVAEPEPEPAGISPEPEQMPEPAAQLPGRWSLHALEDVVRQRGSADPARYEEWMTYLFFLREHATADGSLPRSFDPLVNEVFAPLVGRGPVE
jgi:hypothetical protein